METGLQVVKNFLATPEIQERLNSMLGEKAPQFTASIINTVAGSKGLQKCDASSVMAAAMIAAALDLPIDPNLGFAYIIPYNKNAQFQMGYRGFVQLAIRTGEYKSMNTVEVYEDELVQYNPVLGTLEFVDDFNKTSQRENGETDKIVGFYAWYELNKGFSKGFYMTTSQARQHAEKYSKNFKSESGLWNTDFVAMAKKTVIKLLLSKWGYLSVQMQQAITDDQKVFDGNGNGAYEDNPQTDGKVEEEPIDVFATPVEEVPKAPDPAKAEPVKTEPEVTAEPEQQELAEFEAFEQSLENDDIPFFAQG